MALVQFFPSSFFCHTQKLADTSQTTLFTFAEFFLHSFLLHYSLSLSLYQNPLLFNSAESSDLYFFYSFYFLSHPIDAITIEQQQHHHFVSVTIAKHH